jgi:hypothetical protein
MAVTPAVQVEKLQVLLIEQVAAEVLMQLDKQHQVHLLVQVIVQVMAEQVNK